MKRILLSFFALTLLSFVSSAQLQISAQDSLPEFGESIEYNFEGLVISESAVLPHDWLKYAGHDRLFMSPGGDAFAVRCMGNNSTKITFDGSVIEYFHPELSYGFGGYLIVYLPDNMQLSKLTSREKIFKPQLNVKATAYNNI